MTFEYTTLSADESRQLGPRVVGPVLGFDGSCAIDRQAGAILLDLGGQPGLDPARGEPPGHYNLLWNDQTVAATGHFTTEKRDTGYVTKVSLRLRVPQALADRIDEVEQLFQAGMTALHRGLTPKITDVEVTFDHVRYA